jgi:hypothetical protein
MEILFDTNNDCDECENKPYTSLDVCVEEILVDNVNSEGDTRFNSCNHWDTGIPTDYKEIVDKTLTKEWIDQFHTSYYVINIDNSDIVWMKEASNVSFHTATISKLHKEEIDKAVGKYSKSVGNIFDGTKYFIRAENVSLKEGIHGIGPYTNMRQVIESLITCNPTHTPVSDDVKQIKLYLLSWIDIYPHKEFRVFVYMGNITAISQQHIYVANDILKITNKSTNEIIVTTWADQIVCYFKKYVKDRIKIDSYCMDIAITDDNSVYFIEINPFGKEYSAGSALFHWVVDQNKLYNTCGKIYCRYTI